MSATANSPNEFKNQATSDVVLEALQKLDKANHSFGCTQINTADQTFIKSSNCCAFHIYNFW